MILARFECELINVFRSSHEGYLGSQASKTLDIMAHLLLYCPVVYDFVCKSRPLKLLGSLKDFAKLIPHRNGFILNDYYVLRLLLSITGNIGKYVSNFFGLGN